MTGQSRTTADEAKTASWWGRTSGDPKTIHCTQSGWREATWKRDKRGKWYEAEATLRPVIAIDPIGNVTLGEPRIVKHGK